MPNILSSIGRSGAVGDFVKEARMLRKQDADIAMDRERLDLSRAEGGRADIRLGLDKDRMDEELRAMREKNKREQEAYDENNKEIVHNPDLWGNKGVNSVAEKWFEETGRGERDPNGKLIYKNKHIKEFSDEMKTNTMLQRTVVMADLKSTGAMYDTIKAAMDGDQEAFKRLKAQDKDVTPEALPQMFKEAEMEYERVRRDFKGINAKAEEELEIKRQAAEDRTEALKDSAEAKRMQAEASKISANAAMINAGANVEKAKAATTKAEKDKEIKKEKLTTADHNKITKIMEGWETASESQKLLDSEFLKQRGKTIKKVVTDVPNRWTSGTHKEEKYELVNIEASDETQQVKDKYGFVVGEKKPKDGKTYTYIGNNQWQY